MGNCATCCGKTDTHEVETTEKGKNKLKAEAGYPGNAGQADYGKKGYGGRYRTALNP